MFSHVDGNCGKPLQKPGAHTSGVPSFGGAC